MSVNGLLTAHSFSIINLSANQKQMELEVDFRKQTLAFRELSGKLFTMIDASKIKNLENDFEETQVETILFEGNHRIKVLFMDNRERFLFRSAIGALNSSSKLFSKGGVFEEIKIFCSSFNAGFSEPPELSIWLEKALECEIVVIGMQETKAASWLEKIQQYLNQAELQMITLCTMWKMSICVYVKANLRQYVSNIDTISKPTGIANMIGNKGGVKN
eukprot:CAMPEP_0176414368 /NCGR_PEP_ID=MMETSP0127-20121128/5221_1 /TAXON_ID=938130 /ORGANISM="Platyophrya macrostoma, Strain WH" /LENGTH=216 /DNA_ID=CAMNT_0017794263 /DNA_START=37 /DNA_END=687 /DNA_ORIENTATION=+